MRGDGVPTYALTLISPHPRHLHSASFPPEINNKQRLRFNNIISIIIIMITISSIFTTIETNYYNNKHIVTKALQ